MDTEKVHRSQLCDLSCKAPLLDDTWTPIIKILAEGLMCERAPAKTEGNAGTRYGA